MSFEEHDDCSLWHCVGNSVALNVKGGGPGTGRTLYGQSGSQGCHGQPAQGERGLPSTKGQWPD